MSLSGRPWWRPSWAQMQAVQSLVNIQRSHAETTRQACQQTNTWPAFMDSIHPCVWTGLGFCSRRCFILLLLNLPPPPQSLIISLLWNTNLDYNSVVLLQVLQSECYNWNQAHVSLFTYLVLLNVQRFLSLFSFNLCLIMPNLIICACDCLVLQLAGFL